MNRGDPDFKNGNDYFPKHCAAPSCEGPRWDGQLPLVANGCLVLPSEAWVHLRCEWMDRAPGPAELSIRPTPLSPPQPNTMISGSDSLWRCLGLIHAMFPITFQLKECVLISMSVALDQSFMWLSFKGKRFLFWYFSEVRSLDSSR